MQPIHPNKLAGINYDYSVGQQVYPQQRIEPAEPIDVQIIKNCKDPARLLKLRELIDITIVILYTDAAAAYDAIKLSDEQIKAIGEKHAKENQGTKQGNGSEQAVCVPGSAEKHG